MTNVNPFISDVEDEDFDIVQATELNSQRSHSPPTPATQQRAVSPLPPVQPQPQPQPQYQAAQFPRAQQPPVGRLPLSPTSSVGGDIDTSFSSIASSSTTRGGNANTSGSNSNSRYYNQPERDLTAPPVPPKPSTYTSQIEVLAQKMSQQSNLEDSYMSMNSRAETDSNYGWDFGGGSGKEDSYSRRVVRGIKDWTMGGSSNGNKEVLIAVMGMTGSGKTTFISKVTGRTDLKIGHDLTSCTQDIQVYSTTIDGHTVRFVDTPGFSDTYLSDTEVLEMIADYLAAAYTKDVKLNGIIYLHPISDKRVTHHATKNLEMFRKLTGEKNLKNVILATSMWDLVTPEEGSKRERELKEKFWKVLMAYEAKTVKYRGSQESAIEIAEMLMENKGFYLQLQEEMGKGNKALKDTSAGRAIMQELVKLKEQHQKELSEMKDMIVRTQEEKNDAAMKALEEHYQGMLKDMEKTMRDERRMNDEAVKSLTERISALESRGMCTIV